MIKIHNLLFGFFTKLKKGKVTIMMTLLITGCATSFVAPKFTADDNPYFESGDKNNRGYKQEEAEQFIEFCVDLDNQDDRENREQKGLPPDSILAAQIDKNLWDPGPIYDSRKYVAEDVNRYIHEPNKRTADDAHWGKLYDEIGKKADKEYAGKWDEQTIEKNPNLNGFGPWQNAWTLYKGVGKYEGAFAIAIRGTVLSSKPSVNEDVILNPVDAQNFLSEKVSLAGVSDTSLHGGFAHATFTLMLDDRYGVLSVLKSKGILDAARVKNTRLYIIGHSQGAAMATLAHAFMHYALRNDNGNAPGFGLNGVKLLLKSYGFAQPKPGNYTFAADFARITQRSDNAIVINNAIDPVPKVPLTLQGLADLDFDVTGNAFRERLYRSVGSVEAWLQHAFAKDGEKYMKDHAKGYSYYYNYNYLQPIGNEKMGDSWDFVPAGKVIMVYGTAQHLDDPFYQHHATTYRELIRTQLPLDKPQ